MLIVKLRSCVLVFLTHNMVESVQQKINNAASIKFYKK